MQNRQLDEESIFHIARDLSDGNKRNIYLDQICAGDQPLRERVEALLAVYDQQESFLRSNSELAPTADQSPVTEASGQQIGRYKLLQKIGEGGFGVVYMAEQARPVRRKVALKIIKPGMDTTAVIARFEAERQALALMDHPNIARVLDGGATESGRPYFVMELVKGVSITEYCDKNQLNTDRRLELFMTVCQSVQHAHQKGIIHRDLKPSNILITLADGQPIVKVIDFGVAKAMNQQLTERTLFTAYGQMVGTPQYMSPEQAEMSCLDVDTRSDVYSLGVVLYELLTGTTPLEAERLRTAGYAEMQRIIRDEELPKPSTRLSTTGESLPTIAQLRSATPDKLKSQIQGDLDWIAMKALEKDRNRRYESPSGLARDVSNFLQNEPVNARPPTIRYRTAKYLKRNRVPMAITVVLMLFLALGLAGTMWQARNANLNAERADEERQKAEATLNQLVETQLEESVVAALGGDKERASKTLLALAKLVELHTGDVKSGDLDLLKALIAMIDKDLDETKRLARRVRETGCSILGDECVGVQALIYLADYWSSRIELAEPESAALQNATPTTDVDKLLLAYAVNGFNPYQAKELLESIEGNAARTPVGFLIDAQCQKLIAVDSRDGVELNDAVNKLNAACYLLNHSELPATWRLGAIASAIELARQQGRDADAEKFIAYMSDRLKGMRRDSSTAWHRWHYFSLVGDKDETEQACRDAASGDWIFVAIDCMNNRVSTGALLRFDELTNGVSAKSDWYYIARTHLLYGTSDGSTWIRESLEPLLNHPAPIIRRHALAALCVACDPNEIRELWNCNRSIADEMRKVNDLWQGEHMVSFFAGEITRERLVELAGDHAYTLSNAGFMIGMMCLAEDRLDEACRYFRRAVEQGGIGSIDYVLAKAYLMRLAGGGNKNE